MSHLVALVLAAFALTASSFLLHSLPQRLSSKNTIGTKRPLVYRLGLSSTNNNNQIDPQAYEKIDNVIKDNKVVLFMKGNKLFPQCGFSNTACRILDAINTPYETVNVLEDDRVRNGIKIYSSWPTIPQLYVNGEFVGGSDIMIELYQNGQLQEMLEIANAN